MKSVTQKVVFICLSVVFSIQFAIAASPTTEAPASKTVANVLVNLNHTPTDTEKKALQQMVEQGSLTEAEKSVITALIRLNHRATEEDKQALNQIITDDTQSKEIRELARIVSQLNHKPSSQDKESLRAMMD